MANTIRFIKSFSTSRVAEEIYNKQKASGRPSISASAYGMNSLLVADCLQHEAMARLENADGGEVRNGIEMPPKSLRFGQRAERDRS